MRCIHVIDLQQQSKVRISEVGGKFFLIRIVQAKIKDERLYSSYDSYVKWTVLCISG